MGYARPYSILSAQPTSNRRNGLGDLRYACERLTRAAEAAPGNRRATVLAR